MGLFDRFRGSQARWIWPGVFGVELDGVLLSLLVYRQRVDMFWALHQVVPLPDVDPALRVHNEFWEESFERAVVRNLWTGWEIPTFPAGGARNEAEITEGLVTLRSLHPVRGKLRPGGVPDRDGLRNLIEQEVEPRHIAGLQELLTA